MSRFQILSLTNYYNKQASANQFVPLLGAGRCNLVFVDPLLGYIIATLCTRDNAITSLGQQNNDVRENLAAVL